MTDVLVGTCRVEACGAAVEGEPTAVRSWLVWHVYDDHRDWWEDALQLTGQEIRPPYDERPDLSLIMPWPPLGPPPVWVRPSDPRHAEYVAYRKARAAASAFLPECPECGARPGQAHDPTCQTKNP